jgi:hypothetical protein
LSTGRKPLQPARYMHLVDWKGFLPVGKVHVPRWLEGFPSNRQGTCTFSTGRVSFQLTRYSGWTVIFGCLFWIPDIQSARLKSQDLVKSCRIGFRKWIWKNKNKKQSFKICEK